MALYKFRIIVIVIIIIIINTGPLVAPVRRTTNSVKQYLLDEVCNERTGERTDAGNRIWCILALKCGIWWQ